MRSRLPLWAVVACVFVATAVYVRSAAGEQPSALPSAAPSAPAHSDGLSDSFDGYRLQAQALPRAPGAGQPLSFDIVGPDGSKATDFAVAQTMPLHLYVLRDDLSWYQHLHPTPTDGTWNATIDVPDGGAYRLYAEFMPKGADPGAHPVILGVPFVIPGDTSAIPLPAPEASVAVDGLTVSRLDGKAHLIAGRSTILGFRVADEGGAPVDLLPYLGAAGHLSAFEARTMRLAHMHAAMPVAREPGTIYFHAVFPNRGEQRLFLQFQTSGKLHLAAFTVFVT